MCTGSLWDIRTLKLLRVGNRFATNLKNNAVQNQIKCLLCSVYFNSISAELQINREVSRLELGRQTVLFALFLPRRGLDEKQGPSKPLAAATHLGS